MITGDQPVVFHTLWQYLSNDAARSAVAGAQIEIPYTSAIETVVELRALNRTDASWMLLAYQHAIALAWFGLPRILPGDTTVLLSSEALPEWVSGAEFVASTHALFVASVVLLAVWYSLYVLFCAVWPAFSAQSDARKWYIVANLSKAVCLAAMCLTPSFVADVYDAFYAETGWQHLQPGRTMWIKRVCALYTVTDLVALAVVPKMPSTTVMHHIVTGLITLCIFATDLVHGNVARMMALYGAWSSLAFPVNAFLALRCMYDERWWMAYVAAASFLLYAVCCAFNWTWHAAWFASQLLHLRHNNNAAGNICVVVVYCAAVAVLARDDLILMSWLWRRMKHSQESLVPSDCRKCHAE